MGQTTEKSSLQNSNRSSDEGLILGFMSWFTFLSFYLDYFTLQRLSQIGTHTLRVHSGDNVHSDGWTFTKEECAFVFFMAFMWEECGSEV